MVEAHSAYYNEEKGVLPLTGMTSPVRLRHEPVRENNLDRALLSLVYSLRHFADVAQSAEHAFCKRVVVGSIPTVGSRHLAGHGRGGVTGAGAGGGEPGRSVKSVA